MCAKTLMTIQEKFIVESMLKVFHFSNFAHKFNTTLLVSCVHLKMLDRY